MNRLKPILADERVSFLLVGGFNTALGFATFVAADLLIGRPLDRIANEVIGSLVTLGVSHVIGVIIAFFLYRRFVFRVVGHFWRDLARFESVYLISLTFNAIALPLLVTLGAPRIPSQLLITIVTAIVSYVGHKYFSFHRPAQLDTDADVVDGPSA